MKLPAPALALVAPTVMAAQAGAAGGEIEIIARHYRAVAQPQIAARAGHDVQAGVLFG